MEDCSPRIAFPKTAADTTPRQRSNTQAKPSSFLITFFEGPGKTKRRAPPPKKGERGRSARRWQLDSAPLSGRDPGCQGRRRAESATEVGPQPRSVLLQVREKWRWGLVPGTSEGRAGRGGSSLAPGTDRSSPFRGRSPPRPGRRSPRGGAARPQAHLLPLLLLALGLFQGCLELHDVPPEEFPGHYGPPPPPPPAPGAVATTTPYGHRQRERKRGQGGRRPGPCVTSGPRTARREQKKKKKSSPNSAGGKPQPPLRQ